VSSDKRWVLGQVPRGTGFALDLGGGLAPLAEPLAQRGFTYVNVDRRADIGGERRVRADANHLPFPDASFAVVVSSDSLEHFASPLDALVEARRLLAPDGRLVVWVPFLHPFHGDDLYRYTPLGLEHLCARAGLQVRSLTSPLGVTSVFAQVVQAFLQRVGLARLGHALFNGAAIVDGWSSRRRTSPRAFAAAYLLVAQRAEDEDLQGQYASNDCRSRAMSAT
jgi:SAM-dependent methyltransferase